MHVLHTVGVRRQNPNTPRRTSSWLVENTKKMKKKKTSPITDHITPCVLTSCRLRPLKTIENCRKQLKTVENRRKPSKTVENRRKPSKTVENRRKPSKTVENRRNPTNTVENH